MVNRLKKTFHFSRNISLNQYKFSCKLISGKQVNCKQKKISEFLSMTKIENDKNSSNSSTEINSGKIRFLILRHVQKNSSFGREEISSKVLFRWAFFTCHDTTHPDRWNFDFSAERKTKNCIIVN